MLDLRSEPPLSLSDATKWIPTRPHIATVWRWCLRGVRGIKLESCVVGGRRVTSEAAIGRFIERTSQVAECQPPLTSNSTQRLQQIEAAERQLDEAGVK